MALRTPRIQALATAPARVARTGSTVEPVAVVPKIPAAKPRDTALLERMRQMAAARAEQKAAAEATEASACNRRTRRKATALPGLLMFKGMRMQVACTIADMSVTGARITISEVTAKTFGDMEHLPDKAILVMRADHMQVDCEVKWRKPGSIGLRFLGPPVALAKPRR